MDTWTIVNIVIAVIGLAMLYYGIWGINTDWGTQNSDQWGWMIIALMIISGTIVSQILKFFVYWMGWR